MNDYQNHVEQLKTAPLTYLLSIADSYPVHVDIKTPDNFVRGCKNYIWFSSCQLGDTYNFKFASGSKISLGMCIILGTYLSGKTAEQILAVKYNNLKDFTRFLPGERQKGVQAVLNRIHQSVNKT